VNAVLVDRDCALLAELEVNVRSNYVSLEISCVYLRRTRVGTAVYTTDAIPGWVDVDRFTEVDRNAGVVRNSIAVG
jgi:hypothetical protein